MAAPVEKAEAAMPTLAEAMPNSWFFDIYVDSPEEEAANLMEHSASVLDISSDDDEATKRQNEARERGKENIPPEWNMAASTGGAADVQVPEVAAEPVKKSIRQRKAAGPDDMVDDALRSPLGDLPAKDFYAEGLDEKSVVTVDAHDVEAADKENVEGKPSGSPLAEATAAPLEEAHHGSA